jgi:hypothetical protein
VIRFWDYVQSICPADSHILSESDLRLSDFLSEEEAEKLEEVKEDCQERGVIKKQEENGGHILNQSRIEARADRYKEYADYVIENINGNTFIQESSLVNSCILVGTSFIEDICEYLVLRSAFKFSCQNPKTRDWISDMTQNRREKILVKNGVIDSGLRGQIRQVYKWRSEIAHNSINPHTYPAEVSDEKVEKSLNKIKNCVNELDKVVKPKIRGYWKNTDGYSDLLRRQAIQRFIKEVDDEIISELSSGVDIEKLDWEKDKFFTEDSMNKYNFVSGVDESVSIPDEDFHLLDKMVRELPAIIRNIHGIYVLESGLNPLEYYIHISQHEDSYKASNYVSIEEKYVERKSAEIKSREFNCPYDKCN